MKKVILLMVLAAFTNPAFANKSNTGIQNKPDCSQIVKEMQAKAKSAQQPQEDKKTTAVIKAD